MTTAASRCRPAQPDPGPRFVLRTATRSDLPALHALAGRAVRELLGGHYTAAQLRAAASTRIYEVEPELLDAGTYYVIEIDGQLVAGSGWSPGGALTPAAGAAVQPGTAAMRASYVDPPWARRGLATLLARTAETAATVAGCTRFEALCTPASEALRRRLGYRIVERVEFPLAGITLSAARMRKEQEGQVSGRRRPG